MVLCGLLQGNVLRPALFRQLLLFQRSSICIKQYASLMSVKPIAALSSQFLFHKSYLTAGDESYLNINGQNIDTEQITHTL